MSSPLDESLWSTIGPGRAAQVRDLLARGADPNYRGHRGWTPVHRACLLNAPDALAVLLDSGGRVAAADEDGETPLHLAALNGHLAPVEQLLQAGANVCARSSFGAVLDRAAFGGNPAILAALLDAGAVDEPGPFGRTALHEAAARGQLNAARLLLRRGAAVDPVDSLGNDRTPLHEAVSPGDGALTELLLTYGANINHRNNWGATALHMAARTGAIDAATVLLRHGADPQATDREGRTPVSELRPSPLTDEFRNLLTAGVREREPLPPPIIPERPGKLGADTSSPGPSAWEQYRLARESFAATLGHDGFMSREELDRRNSVFQDLHGRLNFRYQPDGEGRLKRNADAVELLTGRPAFGSAAEVAAQIRVIPFREVLRLDRFQRRQEMEGRCRWLTPADDPLLVICVSHRWEQGDNPDPYGTQLTTLKRFVAAFLDVATGLKEPREQRVRRVPTLAAHGALQASYFVGVIAPFIDAFTGAPEALREQLLDRVGVVYDFVSLPQSPRTKEEQTEFVRGMAAFHRAMTSTPVLALRWPDDEYPSRSWCELEMWSAGRAWGRGFSATAPVLRTDLWGRGVPLRELAPPPTYGLAAAHSVVTSAVTAWRSKEIVTAGEVAGTVARHYHDAFGQAEKRHRTPLVARPDFNAVVQNTVWKGKWLETPGAVVPTSFRLWRGHREVLMSEGLDDQDYAEVIRVHMKATGIACTDERDLVPTGLWLLGCHDAHSFPALLVFWGRCLLRYLVEGKDLRVRLFVRWTNERVHFKFADGEESIE